jgi:hypothetical protein
MKTFTPFCFALTFACMTLGIINSALAETTPAGQDKLRIHTSQPKRNQDSLFSYTVEWRIDEKELFRSYAITFLNGKKFEGDTAGGLVAKKLVTAMKDGLIQLDPNWRGITVEQAQEHANFTIANKTGFSLTTVTVRDYSNQAVKYDLVDKTFTEAGVQLAFDLVYTGDVEYIDDFATRSVKNASQGEIIVKIDDEKPVHIKTDGKTTAELEAELAEHFGSAHLSKTPVFPTLPSSDTRNIKPFDNSEVQFLNLEAKSISIDITDPELGVLSKFKYLDNNGAVHIFEPRLMMFLFALVSVLTVGFLWFKNRKSA